MLFDYLPKEPWGFMSLAAVFALLAIIGDTIMHGFSIEDVVGGVVVGVLGTGGGYLLAKVAGAL